MTTLTWAALGAAALLAPGPSRPARRARSLALRGRLGASGTRAAAVQAGVGSRAAGALAAVAAVGAVTAVAVAGGPVLGVAAAVAAATGGWLAARALQRRARVREHEQLAAAIGLVAAELDAGASPAAALDGAADLAPAAADQLRAAARQARTGDEPDFAPTDGDVAPAGGLEALGHAWRLAASAGVPLAEVCRRVAADLQAAREQRQAVVSALAGARSSAALLAGLPGIGLALGSAMQADPVGVLVNTASGQVVCLVGIVLDAAGLLWTHWLTARAEGP